MRDNGENAAGVFSECVCEFFEEVYHGVVSFYVWCVLFCVALHAAAFICCIGGFQLIFRNIFDERYFFRRLCLNVAKKTLDNTCRLPVQICFLLPEAATMRTKHNALA